MTLTFDLNFKVNERSSHGLPLVFIWSSNVNPVKRYRENKCLTFNFDLDLWPIDLFSSLKIFLLVRTSTCPSLKFLCQMVRKLYVIEFLIFQMDVWPWPLTSGPPQTIHLFHSPSTITGPNMKFLDVMVFHMEVWPWPLTSWPPKTIHLFPSPSTITGPNMKFLDVMVQKLELTERKWGDALVIIIIIIIIYSWT